MPSKRQGSGLVSLQSLFLLLHFGQKRINDGESFCMALEEPELHLPPPIQRRVLCRLQSLSTQTIVSTHSPLVAAFSDATSVLILRNDGGVLSAKPMLDRPLGQEATNAVRKPFQINRIETSAAVMSDFVLVPEGRLDFDWLSLLTRSVELDQEAEEPCLFGIRVGLVPTSDAKVKETCEVLSKVHPNVCSLLDGDEAGNRYVVDLSNPEVGARKVIQWPSGWTIEDVVCWILEADEAVVQQLNQDFLSAAGDLATLLARLKSDNRANYGIKGDLVAYEIIANALADHPLCVARARAMLQGLSQACAGLPTSHFEVTATGQVTRLVFKPCP